MLPVPPGPTRKRHHLSMTVRAELSSLTSTLTELTRRVVDLAESARDDGDAETANDLFGVERALREAIRRIGRIGS